MYTVLVKIREKVLEAEELSEQIARLSSAYKGLNYDGMPKGGAGDAMTMRMIAKDFVVARRDELKAEIKELEEQARGAIEKLPAHLYAFCTYYYLGGYTMEETCKIIDRDETTFYRYKSATKKMLG